MSLSFSRYRQSERRPLFECRSLHINPIHPRLPVCTQAIAPKYDQLADQHAAHVFLRVDVDAQKAIAQK